MTTPKNLIIALCALVVLVMGPVSALINVTPISVGTSYIIWEWNSGLTLSDMYIDGNLMCGYETTDNQYAITGLKQNESHNITVYTTTDYGSNTTFTLKGGAGTYAYQPEAPTDPLLPAGALLVGCVAMRTRKNILMNRILNRQQMVTK